MAHIPIGTTATRISYTATSAQTAFVVPFEYFDEADLDVYSEGTLLTVTTHYTTTPNTTYVGGFDGGTVTLVTGATLNDTIVIALNITPERATDFPTSGAFNINTLNTWIDKMIVMFKSTFEKIDRKVGRPDTSVETYSLDWPDAATTTPGIVVVSSDAGIEISAIDPSDLTTSVDAAAASAAAALVSENAAAADLVLTNADVVTTNADVVLADAAAVLAQAAAAGIYWKAPVVNRSTADLTLSGEQTIDGVLTSTSRILVMNQTAAAENGIYVTAAGAWARATPLDTWDEHVGAVVLVSTGTAYSDQAFMCTVDAGGTLETTDVTWGAFGAVAVNFSVDNYVTVTDYTAGTTTTLVITTDCGSEENARISFDGLMQHHSTYTYTSGTRTFTFDAAIPLGTLAVEIQYGSSVGIGTPSDGTVSTAKIAALAVTTAKIATNNIDETLIKDAFIADFTEVTVAAGDSILLGDVGDSGNTRRDTVQGILDLVPAPGGRVLLETLTPSAASTTTLTAAAIFDGTYEKIEIEITGYTASVDGDYALITVSTDGGSTFKSSAYAYHVSRNAGGTTTYLGNASSSAAYIQMANQGNGATESSDRTIWVKRLNVAAHYKLFVIEGAEISSAGLVRSVHGVGTWKGTGAIDAIRFAQLSGTISATIRAYGIPNT